MYHVRVGGTKKMHTMHNRRLYKTRNLSRVCRLFANSSVVYLTNSARCHVGSPRRRTHNVGFFSLYLSSVSAILCFSFTTRKIGLIYHSVFVFLRKCSMFVRASQLARQTGSKATACVCDTFVCFETDKPEIRTG